MSDASKINASHLRRRAFVYLRQSSAAQVEHNRDVNMPLLPAQPNSDGLLNRSRL
jgi:hypothetical protein